MSDSEASNHSDSDKGGSDSEVSYCDCLPFFRTDSCDNVY